MSVRPFRDIARRKSRQIRVGSVLVGGDALDGFSDGAGVRLRLDDAGTCNEEEPARAHLHRPDFERRTHEGDCTGAVNGGP